MVMWQVRTAVDLLKAALKDGEKPDRQIIAGMLQQIAVLGEVDTLKELHEVLKVEELVTQVWFYKCLSDAYCNSGRLEEGITMLRQEYASNYNLEDVDMFFIMLTVKAITHFPHRLALIEDIINTQETERKLELCATYWLSFVLAEKFDTADTMLKDYLFLKKMISLQLSKLKRSSFEVDYNKDRVLVWLFQQPYITKGLRASLFDFFIVHKCRENEWDEALEHILSAMEQGKKVHKQTLQMFLSKFLSHMSKLKIEQLTDWVDNQKKMC
ncbi:uncharacterized protein LOC131942851 [Physella acuta]|uniref:uncharacterized protein LOC131942851 n=1 Tax=Physella acuta TaxID=109671 RepID=UPI0027DCA7C0|nr:uncharacterized protein LOC131942851 [Physella acuta]XP_059158789.1 uncharacterized protein LOC131942851 [Physella acuta]